MKISIAGFVNHLQLKQVLTAGLCKITHICRKDTEKHKIVQETYQPGATVSYIARKHGIPPSQLFYWRKVMESGAMTGIKTEEELVPVSEVNELKRRIKQLARLTGDDAMIKVHVSKDGKIEIVGVDNITDIIKMEKEITNLPNYIG